VDTGKPTIILEAGMASFSSNFAWVQQNLKRVTRVVAYDRAGLGWSDSGLKPRDAQRSAREPVYGAAARWNHRPYVVADIRMADLCARLADLFPNEVVGMVLIDASHPDQWAHIPAAKGGRTVAFANRMTAMLGRFGLLRFWNPESKLIDGLPPRQYAEMKAFLALPRQWSTGADGLAVWETLTRPQTALRAAWVTCR
jgi:pimeloyl-ACP methyl ester carboxylesterase